MIINENSSSQDLINEGYKIKNYRKFLKHKISDLYLVMLRYKRTNIRSYNLNIMTPG